MSRIRRSGSGGVGGGVIDGTPWKKADGVTDEGVTIKKGDTSALTDNGTFNTNTKTITYTVKNDCYLYIAVNGVGVDVGNTNPDSIAVLVKGVEVGRLLDHMTDAYDIPSCGINVAAGTEVKLEHLSKVALFSSLGTNSTVSFTEFKFKSTPVKVDELYMGEPDWVNQTTLFDNRISPSVDEFHLSSGTGTYTAPTSGWVRFYCACGGGITGPVVTLHVNDKVAYTNSQVDTSDCDPTTIIPVSEGDTLKLTYTQGQIEIYFIPRKKIRIDASDIVAYGSGGVIDGTILKGPTQVDKTLSNSTATLLYTVVNDCCLYMECTEGDGGIAPGADIECHYWLDSAMTKPIFKTTQSSDSGSNPRAFQGTSVPLKAGSQIYGSAVANTSQPRKFNFVEYKLSALDPQIAMPDYSRGVTHLKASGTAVASSGYVMPANGYLLCGNKATSGSGTVVVTINDIYVGSYVYGGVNQYSDYQQIMYPVSKGDVVKILQSLNPGDTDITASQTLDFIYAKAVQSSGDATCVVVARSSRSDAPNWWRVYGDGWCEQGGQIVATSYFASSGTSTGVALNLLIPMETTDYHSSVHCTGVTGDWGNVTNEIPDARTKKSINVICNDTASSPNHTNNKLIWEVKGWISNETLTNIKAGKTWDPSTETWS